MKVSIVIPCYNVSDYIENCLNSVYSQTYTNIEVICVDNNSKDDTLRKINALKNELYPNLIILEEQIPGACAARNKGLSASTGQWIQFLDADDILFPNKIENQMSLIQNDDQVVLIAGAYCVNKLNVSDKFNVIPSGVNSFVAAFTRELGITSSNLWNKKVVEEVGGWELNLSSSQEADLMLRMLQLKNVTVIDNAILTQINERESGQISQSNPAKRWYNIIAVRIEVFNSTRYNKLTTIEKSDVVSYIFAAILIYNRYDPTNSLLFANKVKSFEKVKLLPKFGLSKPYILLIKILGLKNTLRIKRILGK